MFFPIENLPDETLLNIFECLEFKDLGRCLQVSKMFRKIALDQTLWHTVKTVDKNVSAKFLVQALTYGAKYLSLKSATLPLFTKRGVNVKRRKIYTRGDTDYLEFPTENYLKTLNLDIGGDEKILSALLKSCKSLEKLYITRISQFNVFKPDLSCIAINGQSLRILNFGDYLLDIVDVQIICDNCIELKEFAVNLGRHGALGYLSRNLTTKIRKLRIATPILGQYHQEQEQKNCEKLSIRCNELIALSITGLGLTITGISSIMKNLSKSLEIIRFCLDTFAWRYLESIPLAEMHKFDFEAMPNLTKILVSCLQTNFHNQTQQLFDKKLPHVKVILFYGYPPGVEANNMTAFLHFSKKYRAFTKELYPNLENRQITKILHEHWGNLTEEEKLPFCDKNEYDGIAIPD